MHHVHVRLVGGATPTTSTEVNGWVTHEHGDSWASHPYYVLSGRKPGCLKLRRWILFRDGTVQFPTGESVPHPTVWCQTWPWECGKAALIFLVCGRRRYINRDVARLLAVAVYATRTDQRWCQPGGYIIP
jgi:hypothetical protein